MSASDGDLRRVVTALDIEGKAVCLFDGPNPGRFSRPGKKNVQNLLWVLDRVPAPNNGTSDRGDQKIGISPPGGGVVFRVIDYPPTSNEEAASSNQSSIRHDTPEIRGLPPRHPQMHRTRTVDFVIVLEGEITMLLDDSEVHLKAGDVLVQQCTNHAWVNKGPDVCRLAIVLIDAEIP